MVDQSAPAGGWAELRKQVGERFPRVRAALRAFRTAKDPGANWYAWSRAESRSSQKTCPAAMAMVDACAMGSTADLQITAPAFTLCEAAAKKNLADPKQQKAALEAANHKCDKENSEQEVRQGQRAPGNDVHRHERLLPPRGAREVRARGQVAPGCSRPSWSEARYRPRSSALLEASYFPITGLPASLNAFCAAVMPSAALAALA